MSGTKRTLNAEEYSVNIDDTEEQVPDFLDASDAKKLRRTSSYSDNEAQTQLIEEDNGMTNGYSTGQSDNEPEEEDEEDDDEEDADNGQENEADVLSDYKPLHVDFDRGADDKFRYDGSIVFHLRAPTRAMARRIESESCVIRTFTWKLVLMIKVNSDPTRNDGGGILGLFVACEPVEKAPNWSIFASTELTILHATDPKKNSVKRMHHVFSTRTVDWGYERFLTLKEVWSEFLHSPDNTIRIEARIHADPPRSVQWDSKGQTGFVGLRNIGATCYMNSFLQTIYFTKKLRKAVYALPTEGDDLSHSMPLAMQKLFYDLQFTDQPVSTRKLTRSFGWDKPDEFCQHDIQEFCRVLLDKLESKMESTTMEGIIPSLFQGQSVQYVRCTRVEHESRVTQTFYDVPLQVRNSANITESFRDFCKKEILTGDNLYDAGDIHGLQEAERGVKFQRFPPVLCLHLLRFEYDFTLSQHRKINDRFSFDAHLDLSEFLEKPDCSPCSYKLLSILVHSGDNSSGHYVSFINPDLDGQWFKFDDDVVGRVATTDAMDRNFGGVVDEDGYTFNTSAYMLVYIREDCQSDVLCTINREDIPETLVRRCDEDKRSPPIPRPNASNSGDIIEIKVILDDDFHIRPAASLCDLHWGNSINGSQRQVPLRFMLAHRTESLDVFSRRLAREMGVDHLHDIRIWLVNSRELVVKHPIHPNSYSQTILTPFLVYCDENDKQLAELFQDEISDRQVLAVFVEQKRFLDGIYQLLPFNKTDDLLIFVRLYDSQAESLMYIGHFLFSEQQSLQKCLHAIAARLKIAVTSSTSFFVHQAVSKYNQLFANEAIPSANFDLPLDQALDPCDSGCCLIVQIDPDTPKTAFNTVENYFQNLINRQELDVFNEDGLWHESLFKLYLPMATPIREVIRRIAERIDYPAEQIIIQKSPNSTSAINSNSSMNSLHIASGQTLRDLYPHIRVNTPPRKICFKRLPFHYGELAHRRSFRIYYANPQKKEEKRSIQVYPKKSSTVADFLAEIKLWIPALSSENNQLPLRIMELVLGNQPSLPFRLRICSEPSSMDELEHSSNRSYYLEVTPPDTIDEQKDTVLIPVAQYTKENSIQINVDKFFPFFLHVIHNETFADVKQRLQTKLHLSNREFEKYRFSIYSAGKLISRCDENLGRINLRDLRAVQSTCWLGLESPVVTNSRKTRKSVFSEKPIRIN